ncbi:MAG: archease [Chloroflexota bacterium]
MERSFEEVDHTADLAIRVWGTDLADLFQNAAYAMACQLTDVEQAQAGDETEVRVEIDADDYEMLLVEWLSELLYRVERDGVVFTETSVRELTPRRLRAAVRAAPVAGMQTHIKAVTFSELDIRNTEAGYETVIVFDV